ncbi:MAG TPA: MoxR family ATPase [Spirochaetales bacterium]|nr:MoxR family ATPase [Spirochaetales bacterium]
MDPEVMQESFLREREQLDQCMEEIGTVIVGQQNMITGLFMGVLLGGHVLLEGVPGLAKTLAVKTLAETLDAEFKRIQFTPDLLPADLTGTLIYRPQTGEFVPRKGPLFTNIVLADEINRAPAKVQSALLEAMEEKQITIGETTFPLPDPFFVLATQNPIEHEGTYPLPEAELDRFLLKILVQYPSTAEELAILRRLGTEPPRKVQKVFHPSDIQRLRTLINTIHVDERIETYIVSLVSASRQGSRAHGTLARYINFGASPRATLFLYRCAKVQAFFENRTYVIPEDVKAVALPVLRHRIVLSYEAESEELTPDEVIKDLLSTVPVP